MWPAPRLDSPPRHALAASSYDAAIARRGASWGSSYAGRVEDFTSAQLGPAQGFDVLVSEWMGYALLFESMLESVLLARDRWLRPGGAILPDVANIYVAAGDLTATTLDFWDDVYGFDLGNVREELQADTQGYPIVAPVPASSLLGPGSLLTCLDLAVMTAADISFTESCTARVERSGTCHCVVLWFDTLFSERFCREQPVTLTTSPHAPQTHWVQTVFLLKRPVHVAEGDALQLRMSFAKGTQHRSLDIALEVTSQTADGRDEQANSYVMLVSSAADARTAAPGPAAQADRV